MFRSVHDSDMYVRGDTEFRHMYLLTYAVISFLRSLARGMRARAYLSPLASNTLLVPSRLAFLQRSVSGTVLPAA